MRHRLSSLVLGAGAAALFGLAAGAQDVEPTAAEIAAGYDRFDQSAEHWGFLQEYCVSCHNFEDWAGGVAFDVMSADAVPDDAEVWESAMRKLRGRLMPPPGEPRPSNAEYAEFVGWMEGFLDHAATAHPDPGRVAVHRLNRKEYGNAIRDLLGLEIDAAAYLPQDPSAEGFDNVADVLNVSPSFLDQSLVAARAIAIQAVGNPEPRPAGAQYFAGPGNQQTHVEGLPLGTRGGAMVNHYFPADGEYELNIGNLAQALWVANQEFTHTLIATYDGAKIFEMDIGGGEDLRAIDQVGDPAVDAINERLKGIRFNATAGPHEVAVTFLHRSFAESEGVLGPIQPGGGQGNIIRLQTFEIRGPYNPTGLSETPSRARIFSCYPESPPEEAACADEIIGGIARRAYRQQPTEEDMADLRRFYENGRAAGGFENGVRRALTAILAHPKFLYRLEPAPEGLEPGTVYRLGDLELASRLSFFLWSSTPDEQLLDEAAAGRLHEPEVLEAEVRRMLADPRSDTLASNFAFQWFEVQKLGEVDPDPLLFADVPGTLRDDLRTELTLFVDSVFREDRSAVDLLTADHTYLNERLALHYGINDVKGDRFRRVELEQTARYGLLGKGAILMLAAYPNRTSPVLRGQWILANVMGTPPEAPPPGVESLKENDEAVGDIETVRERMIRHQEDPTCHSCHGVLDPLGFALENFDSVGRWRDMDRFAREAIDATGELPDGTPLHGPDDVRAALLERPDQFVQTLTQKMMIFALGRPLTHHDMPGVRAIVREAETDDYRFSSIVLGIVKSDQFQMAIVPHEGPVQEAALHR
jgi:mono/diheme cytochrome c family protein